MPDARPSLKSVCLELLYVVGSDAGLISTYGATIRCLDAWSVGLQRGFAWVQSPRACQVVLYIFHGPLHVVHSPHMSPSAQRPFGPPLEGLCIITVITCPHGGGTCLGTTPQADSKPRCHVFFKTPKDVMSLLEPLGFLPIHVRGMR